MNNERIFITGASSGIGEHLAYEYAKRGATLGLAARRIDRLEQIAEACRKSAGKVFVYKLDVSDKDATKICADIFMKDSGGIDVVIANAGIGSDDAIHTGDAETVNRILTVNILGVTNTLVPFIPFMRDQKNGKLVIISSVAGFKGMAYHGAYSGSKAAVRVMGEGWRYGLNKYNIQLTTICPGFIKSEMTGNNKYTMPFLMDTDVATQKMIRAIDLGKKVYILPWQWRTVIRIMGLVPDWVFYKLFS